MEREVTVTVPVASPLSTTNRPMTLLDPTLRVPLETMPVFPLPRTVLLPEQKLPLHIFEPRYRAMVRDALTSSPYIAIALVQDPTAHEPPAFCPTATVGKIVAH